MHGTTKCAVKAARFVIDDKLCRGDRMCCNRVTRMLQTRKLSIVVIGGFVGRGGSLVANDRVRKLASETMLVEITEIHDHLLTHCPSICLYDWNKLIFTGGFRTEMYVMFDMTIKICKKIKSLRNRRNKHVSVCILQQLFVFGANISNPSSPEWTKSVDFINIEQEHGTWQSAPPMPSALMFPKITTFDTNVYPMGDNNPILYVFDAMKKVWSQEKAIPQNPVIGFSIAAGNGNLYAAGGAIKICWQYNISTESWAKLLSPLQTHIKGALIFHQTHSYCLEEDMI